MDTGPASPAAMTGRTVRSARIAPEARRRELAEAAIAAIVAEGQQGASVRRIAARAGVSVGLINHHFASIDVLIAQAYAALYDRMLAGIRGAVATAGAAPQARISAFIAASFSPDLLAPELLNAFVVFWGMAQHAAPVQRVHQEKFGEYRAMLERDLAAAGAADPRRAALGLSALLDGLWLEWCLSPATFSVAEGVRLAEDWVARLIVR